MDNNYGGNLQRYALMKVLQDMGHDVTHLNLRFDYHLPWYKMPYSYSKRVISKYLFGKKIIINQEKYSREKYQELCSITDPFYQRYIQHTEPIYKLSELKKYSNFDAYVVGSDQVWRKKIAKRYLSSMFLDFLPKGCKAKRIAYGVSLGVAENELSVEEISQLSELYKRFDAVSVREGSALELFKQYGWNSPQAVQVLDPTLLLNKEDYQTLIQNGSTVSSKGNLFCYILDKSKEKEQLIHQKAEELHLKPFELGLKDEKPANIEQWLRSFADAEYVITDSYHGLLFSIIFEKPFYQIRNQFRGNARFDALMGKFGLTNINDTFERDRISLRLAKEKEESYAFLNRFLN